MPHDSRHEDPRLAAFDPHAVTIAKRQYFQPGDDDLGDMFRRVSDWVASPETDGRERWARAFYELMADKRFCPGGRVLAGAATNHGNVLNCFVQDGSPAEEGGNAWVLTLATKLALVTKVGGGNGLNLDPIRPMRAYDGACGTLYLTMDPAHPDHPKVRDGTFLDLVHGSYVTKGYRTARFVERSDLPAGTEVREVGDSVDAIWKAAGEAAMTLLNGHDLVLDLSGLRAEGTPVNGSGGTSSGPSSFSVEVFDNFATWAALGGAQHAGPVATLRYVFAPTLRVIRQGGTRRGAGMATLSITHPDVRDFVTAKDLERERDEGDISTFNISVLVSDAFMGSARSAGRGMLREIAEHAWSTGEPGLIFIDRINAHNPMRAAYGDIKSTNPCFPGDVRLATSRGLVPIGELYRTQEELIVQTDRRTHSSEKGVLPRPAVPAFRTADAADVYRVSTRHGYTVRATADHKFMTTDGWVELRYLQPGTKLLIQSSEGTWSDRYEFDRAVVEAHAERVATAGSDNRWGAESRTGRADVRERFDSLPTSWTREVGTFLGFLSGDGFISADEAGITFARDDVVDLTGLMSTYRSWFGGTLQEFDRSVQLRFGRVTIGFLDGLGVPAAKATTKRVPESIFTAPREAVVGYLQGLFTADGTVDVSSHGKSCTIRLASSSRGLLGDVQMLLANFGISSRIHLRRKGGEKPTPDGPSGDKIYAYAAQYELLLDKANRDEFVRKIGFLTAAKTKVATEYLESKTRPTSIENYETDVTAIDFDGVEAVYDTTEPITHSVIANGLVAHQCGEIPLYAGEPCDLGAMNLAAYVATAGVGMDGFDREAFRADVATTVRFLDDVLDVNRFALDDNRAMSMKLRRLGLGVMGLADALIKMGYAYDSDDGRAAVHAMISELHDAAVGASEALAVERGAFPSFDASDLDRERRNVAVLTVAPTGTTSMLMGVSSGVEPVFAPFVYRKIGDGYAALIHPLFQELLDGHDPHPDFEKDGGWDWDTVVQRVQDNHGSVQGLDFVPDEVKSVLICAHDIRPADHVKMQGVVQRAFDGGAKAANSISKTINLPNAASVDDVFDAYALAFDEGCKGITVYRDGSRQFQVLSTKAEKKAETKQETRGEAAAAGEPRSDAGIPRPAPVSGGGSGADQTGDVTPQVRTVTPPAAPPVVRETGLAARARREDRLPGEPLFDRPGRLEGFTDAVKLTLTSGESRGFYVIVNKQDGLPSEVFILSGKAGDEANADSEALGRVVSIALQYGVPAEALVKTLRGINGGMYGSYQGRMVASKADLIAVALETAGVQNVLNHGKGCPDCGAPLRFEEGCMKCESCGFSKCG